MSDPGSGLSLAEPKLPFPVKRSEASSSWVGCCGPVPSGTQTRDNEVAFKYALRTSSPTSAENAEVDVSKDLLAKTLASMASAVPTRCDYREARPTIYKVPKELKRGEDDEGYEPVAARIGPFTGRNNSTAQLENYKWCCVRQLIISWHSFRGLHERRLNCCLESMKRLEPQIRESYSQDIEDNSDDLALNMLLDGCFILRRLLKYTRLEEDDDWTQLFGRIWVWQLVTSDLLLLENQIPFFVLRKLFELLSRPNEQLSGQEPSTQGRDPRHGNGANVSCSPLFTVVHHVWPRARHNPGSAPVEEPKEALVKGSLRLFRSLCPHMVQRSASEIDYHGVHHLLHLFYLSVAGPIPTPQPSERDSKPSSHQADDDLVLDLPQWIPSAKELEEAGVRFRKKKNAKRFLDIKFDCRSGVLEIPQLRLYDFSDKLFRSLIAFEQTYPGTWCDITTYAVFMDCLINTPEDMRIMHLRGILVNQINGEQDASRFFSRICAQVRWSADKNYLKDVMEKVNNYRGSRLHKWRAVLVRNYFSNPWVAMSVLAAVLLLAMTILQTTFTVYPYFRPPK